MTQTDQATVAREAVSKAKKYAARVRRSSGISDPVVTLIVKVSYCDGYEDGYRAAMEACRDLDPAP